MKTKIREMSIGVLAALAMCEPQPKNVEPQACYSDADCACGQKCDGVPSSDGSKEVLACVVRASEEVTLGKPCNFDSQCNCDEKCDIAESPDGASEGFFCVAK